MMKNISNPIIPIKQEFYNRRTNKIVNWKTNSKNSLDLQAMASFCSLGFMLDDDTFYNEIRVCKPATEYRLNEKSEIAEQKEFEVIYQLSDFTVDPCVREKQDSLARTPDGLYLDRLWIFTDTGRSSGLMVHEVELIPGEIR